MFYLEFIMSPLVLQQEIEHIFKIFCGLVLGGAVGGELLAWLGEGLSRG